MDTVELYDRVLAHFAGSPTKFAAAVAESVPAVCNWRTRGIPAHKARAIASLTGISVRELRPDDWHLYWPEPKPRRKAAKVPA